MLPSRVASLSHLALIDMRLFFPSDLKARNIMLKSSGTEGRGVTAKVADFGLSTRMEHQETHLSSCFQGTLTHMAPEVMLEGRISKAADVYSVREQIREWGGGKGRPMGTVLHPWIQGIRSLGQGLCPPLLD